MAITNTLRLGLVLALAVAGFRPALGQTLLRESYSNLPGTTLADLTNAASFPQAPAGRDWVSQFEVPPSSVDNFGARLRGYLNPPVSGPYVFWIASADASELRLSTDDQPANLRPIAGVNSATAPREWDREPNQQADPVWLEAGRRYYVEALHKAGVGLDHLSVAWLWPDGTLEQPIPAARLSPWLLLTNPPAVTLQPLDQTVFVGEEVRFLVQASGADPLFFQWQRNGVNLVQERSPTLWIESASLEDTGAGYGCLISNHLGSVTSRLARLTVRLETNPPVMLLLTPPAGSTVRQLSQVEVEFNGPVVGVDAADLLINGQPATAVTGYGAGPYLFQFPPPSAGTVQAAWSANHGIRDFASESNGFRGGSWTWQLDPFTRTADVVISEVLAANQTGLRDEDGDSSDWIELWNRGTTAVNLGGWSLSDDPNNPAQWVFPSKTLGAGQYLVVFASGKDRTAPTGTNRFHTSFSLSPFGEYLGLFAPESPRVVVSEFAPAYPEQRNDYSYGLDSAGNRRYFQFPTPGLANGASTVTGRVAEVEFSVARGFFGAPFNLTLSTPTTGAVIRCTTDGSEPSATNGFTYTNSLRLTATALLRAAAFATNCLPSATRTHSYFFNLSDAQRSLPVLSIVAPSNNLWGPTGIMGIGGGTYVSGVWQSVNPGDYFNPSKLGLAWERATSAEYIQLQDNGGFQTDCGIRIQGGAYIRPRYTATSKFSYRLYFRGDYGPTALDYPLFAGSPMHEFKKIVLRAGMNDPTNPFIRDELFRRLAIDEGRVDAHGTLVNLFINGVYKGYYNPTERLDNHFMQSWHGGGEAWDVIQQGSAATEGTTVEWTGFRNFVNASDPTVAATYAEIGRRFDLPNFVDYLLIYLYGGCGDWPHNNWRAARERVPTGVWRFYIWDAEWSFGYGGRAPTMDMFANELNGGQEIPTLYKKLRTSPEFRLLFADRVQKHFFNDGALTDLHATNRFNELRAQMAGVLPSMDQTILSTWLPRRRATLLSQLDTQGLFGSSNAPVFSQNGGLVPPGFALRLTVPGGTVYYTTDGTDPRVMFTGAVASNALAYAAPIPLFRSTLVKARTLVGTVWSALSEAPFQVNSPASPVQFTEIMYRPPGGDAFEFLELQNLSAVPLDLSGWSLEGVTFLFPAGSLLGAGARLVLCSDLDTNAFCLRYPALKIAGCFGGSLKNNGERLLLRDRLNQIVAAVSYDQKNGWPTAADGAGASLELVDPFGTLDDPANWVASSVVGGTPGAAPLLAPASDVRFHEIMAENLSAVTNADTHPDWIELHNAGSSAADLTGWSLTDDGNPRKFVFPAGTSLSAGGYLVVWCDSTNTLAPGYHAGFALDREGESLFLYDATGQRRDAVSFGSQLADLSLGRIADGWTLTLPTPGAANQAAPTAAATNLALNEWMANPLPGQDDWLELYNRSATLPLELQGLYVGLSNTAQRLTALAFLPPGGFLVLHADENAGPGHLHFKLAAAGGTIILYDRAGVPFETLPYGPQTSGVSQGRFPDGTSSLRGFPGSATPGLPNFVSAYGGPLLNEILARNQSAVTNPIGRVADWLELYNPATTNFDLGGMSLSVGGLEPGQWVFPPGSVIAGRGYLVVWCDGGQPACASPQLYNTGRSLDGDHGTVAFFNPAGQLVQSLAYGPQVVNRSLGLAAGQWRLLATPTPGAVNSATATLGPVSSLRFNEWMADPLTGADWFELFNPSTQPVDLANLYLTDDPSLAGRTNHPIAPFCFVGPGACVRWFADGDAAQGPDHVGFSLNASGESLRLYDQGLNLIDALDYAPQTAGVAQGFLPDATGNLTDFPLSATPGAPNGLPLDQVVINELLAHPVPPLEQAIELLNLSATPVNLSGWYLSDSLDALKKFRIPNGTLLASNGFVVFYEQQFNAGSNAFALNPSVGGEVWLAAAKASGDLTGYRTRAQYGPSLGGVSLGRFATAGGVDYPPLSQPTFGRDHPATVAEFRTGTGFSNTPPRVGPVIFTEVMYHPVGFETEKEGEFAELVNTSAETVLLFDALRPTNTWRLQGALDYAFPTNLSLAPGERIVLVGFDPADAAALTRFLTAYPTAVGARLFGPFGGQLNNAGESLELARPDAPRGPGPTAYWIPYVVVEQVHYGPATPWPLSPDGGGGSLQRLDPAAYGNDPLNWFAGLPTPGAVNGAPPGGPLITRQPADLTVQAETAAILSVEATGLPPFFYQWLFNGTILPGATNAQLILPFTQGDDEGDYAAVVRSDGGASLSRAAHLDVIKRLLFVQAPQRSTVLPGTNVTFSVVADGEGPVTYQWQWEGADLPGATNSSLFLTNVQLETSGQYSVRIADSFNSLLSPPGLLTVLVKPLVLDQPQSQALPVGATATIQFTVYGTRPMAYRWLKSGAPIIPFELGQTSLVLPNLALSNAGVYKAAITNEAFKNPGTVTSNAVLTVLLPPTDQVVESGSTLSWRATVNSPILSSLPATYQWWFNGEPIPGATTTNLTLTNIRPAQAGQYTFYITNTLGQPAAFSAHLTVINVDAPPVLTSQPTNLIAALGSNAWFTVVVAGRGPLSYQWWFNQTNLLPLATNATLALTNLALDSAGAYQVVVANEFGAVTSAVASLTVLRPLLITEQPLDCRLLVGSDAFFTVAASGAGDLRCQWFRNGTFLPGATNLVLSLTNVQTAQAGSYCAVVTDPYRSVTSLTATLTVTLPCRPPALLSTPASQVVLLGSNLLLTAQADGSAPLFYRWWFHQTNLILATTNASGVLSNLQPSGTGSYHVSVSNECGLAVGDPFTLSVVRPLLITQAPQSQTATNGVNVVFTVVASGEGPLTYQWRFAGAALPDMTNASLQLTEVSFGQGGVYDVVVADTYHSLTSSPATLTLLGKPVLTQQPASQVVAVGQTVTLTLAAQGTLPMGYRWLKNGATLVPFEIGGPTLLLTNVGLTNAGTYKAAITNEVFKTPGTASSNALVLVVLPPQSQTVTAGATVTFRAVVQGPPTNSYLWRFNGEPIASGLNTLSPTLPSTNQLILTNVGLAQAGTYDLVVQASDGATNTFPFTLELLLTDHDADGLPDAWEITYGFNPDDPSDALADADHDGLTNRDEFLAGTDPRDPASHLRLNGSPEGTPPVQLVLQFTALSNHTYRVEWSDQLAAGSWHLLFQTPSTSSNRSIQITNSTASPAQRFYRLATP